MAARQKLGAGPLRNRNALPNMLRTGLT
jgi:hypothetical protein